MQATHSPNIPSIFPPARQAFACKENLRCQQEEGHRPEVHGELKNYVKLFFGRLAMISARLFNSVAPNFRHHMPHYSALCELLKAGSRQPQKRIYRPQVAG